MKVERGKREAHRINCDFGLQVMQNNSLLFLGSSPFFVQVRAQVVIDRLGHSGCTGDGRCAAVAQQDSGHI